MKILVIGAGGYIGSAVVRSALREGHSVGALCRPGSVTPVNPAVEPAWALLTDRDAIRNAIESYDAVVFTASVPFPEEAAAMDLLTQSLAHSKKRLVMMSGAMLLSHEARNGIWRDEIYAERDAFVPPERSIVRYQTELRLRAASLLELGGIVVRPPLVWGHGASIQVPLMFDAGIQLGWTFYLGAGLHGFSHVHVDDLADLVLLAAQKGRPGAVYHASNGEMTYRGLAEAVARGLGCEARSVTSRDVDAVIPEAKVTAMFGRSLRIASPASRQELGWSPTSQDLATDIISGSYQALAPVMK